MTNEQLIANAKASGANLEAVMAVGVDKQDIRDHLICVSTSSRDLSPADECLFLVARFMGWLD